MLLPSLRAARAGRVAASVALAAVVATGALASTAGAAKQPKPVVKMSVGDLAVHKVGAEPPTLPDDVRDGVMAAIGRYVDAATVKPLRKGTADPNALVASLSPSVTARLAGPDRAVLLDEGLPKSVARVKVSAAPIALTGLADGDGRVVVVTARLDSTATTKTAKGKLTVKRAGELELIPVDGVWKINGYTLTVDRLGKGLGAPPTADPAEAAPGATAQ